MYQPRVKLEFVRRYCKPDDGWRVCVDIDASEEGRTGNKRESEEAIARQEAMLADAPRVRNASMKISVGDRQRWCGSHKFPYLEGDLDVVAYSPQKRHFIVAEVEGISSGQPEHLMFRTLS
jgi:hypothetical protein